MTGKPSSRPKNDRGQALVEFLVIALALIPLFLLIPLIAKYQDISNATQLASRYVAFDAFVNNPDDSAWKPEAQLAAEVRRRFFGNAEAAIKTQDTAGDFSADRNAFWRGADGAPLIAQFERDVRVSFGASASPDHDAGFGPLLVDTPFALHQLLDLQERGVYTANVGVALANMPTGLRFWEPFDTIDLRMSRSTSVLIGPWAARGPAEIERTLAHSTEVFPAGSLAGVGATLGGAVEAIEGLGGIKEPKLGQLEFWRDVVPQDRLKAAR